jgi:hypothetical protein
MPEKGGFLKRIFEQPSAPVPAPNFELPPKVRERIEKVRARIDQAQAGDGKELNLAGFDLAEFPPDVFSMVDLETLDLSHNNLRTIPARLRELPNLRRTHLNANPIVQLPDVSGLVIDDETYHRCRAQLNSANIAGIWLSGDNVERDDTDWVTELKRLENLRVLYILGDGQTPPGPILRLLENLGDFPLLELTLFRLGLPGVLEGIRKLHHLRFLNLSNNPLNTIPDSIFDLASLEELWLNQCNLVTVPQEILRLTNLKRFVLFGNPIHSPPAEIVNRGLDAIRNYWRQGQDTGVDYLCEAKLVIVGEPAAGKTSLARKIQDPQYKLREREPTTEGIDIVHWQFPTAVRTKDAPEERVLNRDFQVNIWDFGGQEIYHATHQFFLTRRSVYLLVCDDRKEDTDFGYWLKVVEMLSDASPLWIVQNEKQDRSRDIGLSLLRGQFSNLRGAVATNLDTNRGLDGVIEAIRSELEKLPHIGVGLPATWKRVREALECDPRDHITLEQFLAVCRDSGFTRREDSLQLSGYLHDLGICLHFQEDDLLKKTVILKPAWGTAAVYRVLDDDGVVGAKGKFTSADLSRIWSEKKYAAMHGELLRLMVKFQLCYALQDEQAFIAPQLLSSEPPAYAWDASGIVVRYEYVFLPKGILTRFIVSTHHLIAAENLVWKTGVVLERDGSRAEVMEEYAQRRIRIRLNGPDQRSLLAIIDDSLEKIHRSFPRLQYDRHLPCPCTECQEKAEPRSFPLADLRNMALKRRPIQCRSSGEDVDAAGLISDIFPSILPWGTYLTEPERPAPDAARASRASREVFVSYAWTEESSVFVDRLQKALEGQGVRLLRDREEVRYKDSIRNFMRRLGKGNAIVTVISDKYLKSENCMFEMLKIAQAGAFRERIFPIVLRDANIYKATGLVRYVHHWEAETRELDEALKTVSAVGRENLDENVTLYADIRRMFDNIAGTLRDMNALTPDRHEGSGFEELVQRIRAQVASAE